MSTYETWKQFTCEICGQGFACEADWNERHSGPSGQEYHEDCCPECNEDWTLEEAPADIGDMAGYELEGEATCD